MLRMRSEQLFGNPDRLAVAIAVARSDHNVIDVAGLQGVLGGWPSRRIWAQLNSLARAGLLEAVLADGAVEGRYARKPTHFWDACIELDKCQDQDGNPGTIGESQAMSHAMLEHTWSLVTTRLRRVVGDAAYRHWLAPLRAIELSDNRLVLEAPSHTARWLRDRFGGTIQTCAQLALGRDVTVEFAIHDSEFAPDADSSASWVYSPDARLQAVPVAPSALRGPGGNPKLTFDQFVIGNSNRLAHAAALAVAELPAQAYNPLLIFGPPGVGKTHLLSSIAAMLSAHNPDAVVRLITGESFTNGFLAASQDGDAEGFRRSFRDVNVLLVDDIQFLERKTRTEREFLHMFITMQDAGCQIVLTCDRSPRDLLTIHDRLRARMMSSLVVDIMPPDLELRKAIIRKRIHSDGIGPAGEDAISVIAERVCRNVRALEGVLIRVAAFSSLTGRPFTSALAREVLDSLYPSARVGHAPSVRQIQEAVSEEFDVTVDELLSATRVARVVWPRQIAMLLARDLTNQSLPTIGRQFGGRDHTTVLHGCRRAAARVTSDAESKLLIEKLRRTLTQPRSPAEGFPEDLSALQEVGKV